eukprot:TRINITY_DN9149_c0_g1_i1.p1 TRINITY_DN9149_c0_g1~~TRINITY_DN9149_c0_g1_i1.p1  ORF type:complete len:281 (-),score=46.06 TRINITY_DN9149_c0_g1_i1:544-1386(-)
MGDDLEPENYIIRGESDEEDDGSDDIEVEEQPIKKLKTEKGSISAVELPKVSELVKKTPTFEKKGAPSSKNDLQSTDNIALKSTRTQLDHFWNLYSRVYPSDAQLDAEPLTEKNFQTVEYADRDSIASIQPFLQKLEPKWRDTFASTKNNTRGAPSLIILVISADRGETLCRSLSSWGFKVPIAKLWAKGQGKPQQQAATLKSKPVNIVVGTPNRISKLIELEALSLSHLKYVVFDATYRLKPRNLNIFDQYETQADICLFYKQDLRDVVTKGQVKLVYF